MKKTIILALTLFACGTCIWACIGPNTQPQLSDSVAVSADTVKQPAVLSHPTGSNRMNPFLIVLSIGFIAEGGCIVVLFRSIKKANRRIDERKKEINRLEPFVYNSKFSVREQNRSIRSNTSTVVNTQSPHRIQETPVSHTTTMQDTPQVAPLPPDTVSEYLTPFKDDLLECCESKDKAVYQVTYIPGETSGHFEFTGNSSMAIKNRDTLLGSGVCERNGFSPSATQIATVKWGECVKQADGKWKVTKKVQLSFN